MNHDGTGCGSAPMCLAITKETPAKVLFLALPEGRREEKFAALGKFTLKAG